MDCRYAIARNHRLRPHLQRHRQSHCTIAGHGTDCRHSAMTSNEMTHEFVHDEAITLRIPPQ
jgi:hypothetical protein